MRYLVCITAVASIALFALAGTGIADPSDLFIADVPPIGTLLRDRRASSSRSGRRSASTRS